MDIVFAIFSYSSSLEQILSRITDVADVRLVHAMQFLQFPALS